MCMLLENKHMGTADDELESVHARWREMNERLRAHEALLSAALLLYSQGKGPLPDTMMAETRELRTECNNRFKALMAALAARRPG
jgi:hypothetical protein